MIDSGNINGLQQYLTIGSEQSSLPTVISLQNTQLISPLVSPSIDSINLPSLTLSPSENISIPHQLTYWHHDRKNGINGSQGHLRSHSRRNSFASSTNLPRKTISTAVQTMATINTGPLGEYDGLVPPQSVTPHVSVQVAGLISPRLTSLANEAGVDLITLAPTSSPITSSSNSNGPAIVLQPITRSQASLIVFIYFVTQTG